MHQRRPLSRWSNALKKLNFSFIDCQVTTEHLKELGPENLQKNISANAERGAGIIELLTIIWWINVAIPSLCFSLRICVFAPNQLPKVGCLIFPESNPGSS